VTRQYTQKTNFTAGEVTPRLLGRGELRAWENGATELTNVVLHPTGGVSRRPGLHFLAEMPGPARLVSFEFNTQQIYLLVLSDFRLDVYQDGELIAGDIQAPWWRSILFELTWVQSADTLFVAHPEMRTQLVTRTGEGAWSIDPMEFSNDGFHQQIPHHKFADREVTLEPSGTDGTITLTASAPVFEPDHVGVAFRMRGGEFRPQTITSATEVEADVTIPLDSADGTRDWTEAAFSNVRGWPGVVGFHQNRLVLGGSRDLPNHLWLSQTSDIFNFDLDEGLPDEGIQVSLLSDQVNAIRGLLSMAELQIFTTGGEWVVTGDPLTPETAQVRRQTLVGSRGDRYVPPRRVDGASVFVPWTGDSLREFVVTEAGRGFQTNDLTLLADHLVEDVVDIAFAETDRLLYAVLGDGTWATLTQFRDERVTAWTRHETQGTVKAVAVVRDFVYLLVERGLTHLLEVFDAELNTDSALTGERDTPTDTWTGLDHLEGETVAVVADDHVRTRQTVQDGQIVLDAEVAEIEAGLPYTHVVAPMPPLARSALGTGYTVRVRLIEAAFRLQDTAELRVDTGAGPEQVPFHAYDDNLLNMPVTPMTGDQHVRALGWQDNGTQPLWRIVGDAPVPFTLLSATTETKVND